MRRLAWLVWMLLALLPLRGWAVAGMALPDGAATPSTAGHVETSPCQARGAAAEFTRPDPAAADGQSDVAAGHHAQPDWTGLHASPLCEACHAAVALSDLPAYSAAAAQPQALPGWSVRGFDEPDAQRLFKPPRS